MEALARLVRHGTRDDSPAGQAGVDTYLADVRDAQHRYLEMLAEAASRLDDQPGQVANVAALHGRLSQQLFDAQRLILKRRADAHAAVVRITTDAENEVDTILRDAHERSTPTVAHGVTRAATDWHVRAHYSDDLGIWSASDGVARAIDRAFDRTADEALAARQLRELLGEWWRVENQEDQAAIDDASARAAMRIHLAELEAREIGIVSVADGASPIPLAPLPPISMPVPVTTSVEPPIRRRVTVPVTPTWGAPVVSSLPAPTIPTVTASHSRLNTEPILAALDAADHEGLDSVLASLFDTLESRCDGPANERSIPPKAVVPISIIDLASIQEANTDEADRESPPTDDLHIRCDIADVEQVETVRQEAFDRFWGAFSAVRSKPLSRDWVLVQIMLPAVGVIAVLALVLAWVG